MSIGIGHVLAVSAVLLAAGMAGVVLRRDLVALAMAAQLMTAAGCLALVGFARFGVAPDRPLEGEAFALLVLPAAAGQLTALCALAVLARRRRGTAEVDRLGELGG